jgi:hypothetical protein
MSAVTNKKRKAFRKTYTNGKALTFEKVWESLQETDRQMKENAERQKETDRILKENAEQQKETDRILKENAEQQEKRSKEIERQMKESSERLNKQLGKLGGRFGEMVEYMVMPNLIAKFHDLGFIFEKAYQQATIKDKKNNILAEIDITLENGDKVMLVEVKSKPTTEDITEHIERMEKVRRHGDLHGDRRKYLGAVAGMVFNDNEKIFAMKNGFYVIEPSGETFIITAPEGEYSPREW